MSVVRRRVLFGLLAGSLLVSLVGGCVVVADLLDPSLAGQLGLTAGGTQGVIVVAFNNTTSFPATFEAFVSRDATDLTRDSRNFSSAVAAGDVANEVLECPVGVVSPGSLDASFARDGVAAVVTTDSGTEDVTYAGPVLSGTDISCGDLVEIRLVQTSAGTGDTATSAFRIVVVVIPG